MILCAPRVSRLALHVWMTAIVCSVLRRATPFWVRMNASTSVPVGFLRTALTRSTRFAPFAMPNAPNAREISLSAWSAWTRCFCTRTPATVPMIVLQRPLQTGRLRATDSVRSAIRLVANVLARQINAPSASSPRIRI